MKEFKAENNTNGLELIIGITIIMTIITVWNGYNNGYYDLRALIMFIIFEIILIPYLFYTGLMTTFERILKNDNLLIIEERLFFKYKKYCNIEYIEKINLNVRNLDCSHKNRVYYSITEATIVFKNGKTYSFLFKTPTSNLPDKIVELRDFTDGIKIDLVEVNGRNSEEIKNILETASKYQ